MKIYCCILMFILSIKTHSQISFNEHISSIKQIELLAYDQNGKRYNINEHSVEYGVNYLKNNGIKEKYITNRKLLRQIKNVDCKDSLHSYFYDVLDNRITIDVKMSFNKFNYKNHFIVEKSNLKHIDNQIAFGSFYGIPSLEISCLEIIINNKKINIPESAYKNFYDVNQCTSFQLYKPIEVYSSKDGDYIFIYLYGGNAADAYFSKLIFNKEKYITQIVAGHKELIDWRVAINNDFPGF